LIAFLIGALKIIVLLGFVILIHECGHFFIAKLCKIKVTDFAIGFGPTLLKKQGKETLYAIRAIPLGGYINMVGEEQRSDEPGSFSKASIPKRMAILFAGAIVNIIFGLLVYFIIISSFGNNLSTTIEKVIIGEGYQAEVVGLKSGDEVLKINGKKMRLKQDVDKMLEKAKTTEIVLTVERDGNLHEIPITPTKKEINYIGIYLGAPEKDLSSEIKEVIVGSPAEMTGILAGDIVISVNEINTEEEPELIEKEISEFSGEDITILVNRNGEILTFNVKPEVLERYYLGVEFGYAEKSFGNNIYYGFWRTVDFTVSIGDNLARLFTGKVSADQLIGPIGISEAVTRTEGFIDFISLVAIISLSLGVTNLLPIPPLDGGKILLILIEAVRRKPIAQELEIRIQLAGFALLIGLSIYVAYNDVLRMF